MKKLLLVLVLITSLITHAQNVAINNDASLPNKQVDTFLLINAIKEQQQQIEKQQNQIETSNDAVEKLKQQLAELKKIVEQVIKK